MTVIGYQGLTETWPIIPCREGYHVWLWSSGGSDAVIPEGTPCACGAVKWHKQSEDDWRGDMEKRLAEIERRLNDRV